MSEKENYPALTVLIVEDDELMIDILSHFLRELGVGQVHTSTNAEHALAMLNTIDEKTTVIACDLKMPGMDGIEFLRHLTKRRFAGGVIIMSGLDARVRQTAEQLAKAHHLELLGSLAKPFVKSDVITLLDKFKQIGYVSRKSQFSSLSVGDLRLALEQDEFQLFYQPKISAEKEIIGVESLIRWQHPRFGWIPPDAFIPIAEASTLIDDITEMVIEKALDQMVVWELAGLKLKVSVNISMKNLHQLDLPEKISQLMKEKHIDPGSLILELTETVLMKHITEPLEILVRLRMSGVEISLDDFGTGYSSLEQLKNFPFTELKIDRSFVTNSDTDRAAQAILESSVALGKKLGMTIVAEGVENQAEWDTVRNAGCDLIQGFFISRPMAGKDIPGWVQKWQNESSARP